MSDNKLLITIEAKNGSKQVFEAVSRDAQKMGQDVEEAGKRSSRSFEEMKRNGALIGAAVGTSVTALSVLGRSYVAQEQQVRALSRSYGDSTDQILKFSEELQRNTVYSNDAARQSAIYSSSLIQNYDLTAQQITKLIERSADLATVNVTAEGTQIALTDAVSRVSAAIRGEAEAGELLGLSMSDTFLKTEAARRGIEGWSTTMTEAEKAQFRFTIAMEQSSYAIGAAAEAADTNAGHAKQWVNSLQDQAQALGDVIGPAGEYLAVLGDLALAAPIAFAGVGKIAGGLVAAGSVTGATGALTALGGALTAVAAAALIAAPAIAVVGYTAYTAKDNINAVTEETNALTEALNGLPAQGDDYAQRLYGMFSQNLSFAEFYDPLTNTTQTLETTFDELTALRGEYQSAFLDMARSLEIDFANPAAEDIQTLIDQLLYFYRLQRENEQTSLENTRARSRFSDSGYTTTLATNTPRYYGDVAPSGYTGPYQPPQTLPPRDTFSPGTSGLEGAVGMVQPWDQQAADLAAYRAELEATYGAYAGMVEGINSVNDAQSAFKATQDGLLGDQQVYSQQQSEYQSQMSALEAGYTILQERQSAGIPLTKEEQALLDNYPELYGRLEGGSEDAAVAQALLAAQYAENMKKGDELNRTLEGNTEATGDLVDIVQDLILSLEGIPEEVRSRIEIENAQETLGELQGVVYWLNQLHDVHFTVSASGNGISLGNPDAPGITPIMLGGVVGYARGGVVAEMGEAGPELLYFRDGGVGLAATRGLYNVPQGTYVDTAPATKGKLAGMGGPSIVIQNLTVVSNDPMHMTRSIQEYAMGSARS